LKSELARPQTEHEELLQLRGRVTRLRQAEQENVRLKTERDALAKRSEEESAKLPEQDPGFQMRRDKMNYLGNWGLALKVYARTNDGLLPKSLAEAAPSMPNSDSFFSAVGARFRDDQFEMTCQGSLTNLGDLTRMIVVREKEPVRVSNGKWARTYLFADGHTELHLAADGDFTAWEQERLPPRSRP
jgi:prepilin-type processing-associated H-X9-DG protein